MMVLCRSGWHLVSQLAQNYQLELWNAWQQHPQVLVVLQCLWYFWYEQLDTVSPDLRRQLVRLEVPERVHVVLERACDCLATG